MIKILIIVFAFNALSYAQDSTFNELNFFSALKNRYYALETMGKQNFTSLITNSSTEQFAERKWKNKEIFPLQLIWLAPGRLFLAEQGFPSLDDSSQVLYKEMVSDLKAQFQDLMINLKRFYFHGIYKSISENYRLKNIDDLVEVSFDSYFVNDTLQSAYYFGLNGQCLKITIKSKANNIIEEIIPGFNVIKTKWIINSWKVQIKKEDQIEAGYLVNLKNVLIEDIWVPTEIKITVQHAQNLGKTFQDVIKLKNYLFNQPLQFINQ